MLELEALIYCVEGPAYKTGHVVVLVVSSRLGQTDRGRLF